MNETTYLILQCGAPFIYKPAYFQVSSRLTPNSWNFISMQNKKMYGSISLTKNMTKNKIKNYVKYSGQETIDYSKLSKTIRRSQLTNIPLCDLSLQFEELFN